MEVEHSTMTTQAKPRIYWTFCPYSASTPEENTKPRRVYDLGSRGIPGYIQVQDVDDPSKFAFTTRVHLFETERGAYLSFAKLIQNKANFLILKAARLLELHATIKESLVV